jgi:hypothetical protein
MRDKACLITNQAAVQRARGGNFTGLEVAHIFPLSGVESVSVDLLPCHIVNKSTLIQDVWTSYMPKSSRDQVRTRKIADSPHNAILLRADVHSLFDDYQWAVWVPMSINHHTLSSNTPTD